MLRYNDPLWSTQSTYRARHGGNRPEAGPQLPGTDWLLPIPGLLAEYPTQSGLSLEGMGLSVQDWASELGPKKPANTPSDLVTEVTHPREPCW